MLKFYNLKKKLRSAFKFWVLYQIGWNACLILSPVLFTSDQSEFMYPIGYNKLFKPFCQVRRLTYGPFNSQVCKFVGHLTRRHWKSIAREHADDHDTTEDQWIINLKTSKRTRDLSSHHLSVFCFYHLTFSVYTNLRENSYQFKFND